MSCNCLVKLFKPSRLGLFCRGSLFITEMDKDIKRFLSHMFWTFDFESLFVFSSSVAVLSTFLLGINLFILFA